MEQIKDLNGQPIDLGKLGIRMLLGGVIASLLIINFLAPVTPRPEWGKLWMLKPLLVVPITGAMGGALSYLAHYSIPQHGWKRIVSYIVSLFGYIFSLWIGTVLGLNGTLWN